MSGKFEIVYTMKINFSVLIKKYSVPVLFFMFGVFLLVAGIKGKQDSMFMMAAVLMFLAGIMSILYSSGKMKPSLVYIVGIAAGIGAALTMYFSWKSVDETNTYNKNYAEAKTEAIQNLSDIRYAEKVYAEKNGKYAGDWETLIDFIKNGTIPYVNSIGVVPGRKITEAERNFLYNDNRVIDNNMTEKEAYRLSKSPIVPEDLQNFKRDTVQVSLLQTKYLSKSNIEGRKKAGLGKFKAEILPYIPFTNKTEKWKIETKDSVQIGTEYFPAISISGQIPFAKIQGTENETISFGKITSNETAGSWEDE